MRIQTKVGEFLREDSNTVIAGQEVKCMKSLQKKKCTLNNSNFLGSSDESLEEQTPTGDPRSFHRSADDR